MSWYTIDEVIERIKSDIYWAEWRLAGNDKTYLSKPLAMQKAKFDLEISKVLINLPKDKIRHAFLFEACDTKHLWDKQIRPMSCAIASEGRTLKVRELTSSELDVCKEVAERKAKEIIEDFKKRIA